LTLIEVLGIDGADGSEAQAVDHVDLDGIPVVIPSVFDSEAFQAC
jgi:hypothetical protein